MSGRIYKVSVPVLLCFVIGMIILADYYLVDPTLNQFVTTTRSVLISMGEFAIVIGTFSLLRIHAKRVVRKRRGEWIYSIALIVSFFSIVAIGIPLGSGHVWFTQLYNITYTPLNATIYTLVGFFMASSAYRAFRARSAEAAVMLVTACLMMIGRVSIGEMIWPGFPALAGGIMNTLNTAGMRAISIGVAMGFIATAMRILLGYEKSYMGVRVGEEKVV